MSNLWDVTNEIDRLTSRIHCVKNILEVVAEDIQDPHSGAIWAAADSLEDLCSKIDIKLSELLKINREQNEKANSALEKATKKAKKK